MFCPCYSRSLPPLVAGIALMLGGASRDVAGNDAARTELEQVVDSLANDDYRIRRQAQVDLEALAPKCNDELLEIARQAPAETAQRLVAALELVFLKHEDETGERAEKALQTLAEGTGSVAGMAERVLHSNARLRECRARDAIARLGGEVIYYSPFAMQTSTNAAASLVRYGDPGVIFIIWLYEDWKGGEEGLWHLSRFQDTPNLQIYTIPQNGLDPDRILLAANRQLGAEVLVRGGCLGIRGLREINGGCTIRSVVERTAAHRAGLQPEDIIRTLNGHPINSFDDVVEQLRDARTGDVIELEIERPIHGTRGVFPLPPVAPGFPEDPGMYRTIHRRVRLGSWREAHADAEIVRPPTVFRGPFGSPLGDAAPAPPPVPEPIHRNPEPQWILQ